MFRIGRWRHVAAQTGRSTNATTFEASHDDGVLTVRLPKSEVSKAKKIAVKAASTNGK